MNDKESIVVSLCTGCNQWTAKEKDSDNQLHCIICKTIYIGRW